MLDYDRIGTGPPLVLLHAFPLSRKMWEANRSTLAKKFHVITPDLAGFGGSAISKKNVVSMNQMADQVLALLKEIQIKEKIIFLGLSMGGYVLWQIYQKAPQKVRAMVMASTRAAADTTEARENRLTTIEAVEKMGTPVLIEKMIPKLLGKTSLETKPELIETVKGWVQEALPNGVCAALRGMAERADSSSLLKNLSVPTMFLSGEEDPIIPSAEMKEISNLVPNGRFESFPHCGHLINCENTGQFNDHLMNFAESLPRLN